MTEGTHYIIGFGGLYYTLWMVNSNKEYRQDGTFWWRSNFTYLYNLSHSLEEAEQKVKDKGLDYTINEDMRGEKWQVAEYERNMMSPDLFAYGKFTGLPIMKSSSVKDLFGAYLNDKNSRRRVYARRRLIELGELVLSPWTEDCVGSINTYQVFRRYMPTKMHEARQKAALIHRGHFYESGERVELEIREDRRFSFDTIYGRCYVITYLDAGNLVFKYKGSTPPDISTDKFDRVKATIKHGTYKEQNDTYLLRVKHII